MGILDSVGKSWEKVVDAVISRSAASKRKYGLLLAACAVLPVFLPDVLMAVLGWNGTSSTTLGIAGERLLRWTLSLAPAAVILQHAFDLLYLRHHAFPTQQAKDPGTRTMPTSGESFETPTMKELKELYFGSGAIATRYAIPLVLTGFLCSIALAALLDVKTFSSWLPNTPGSGSSIHRAAAFGFVGAYLYVILLLTQRAFRRDVTPGVSLWIAAMFVAGPIMAGVFSVFWNGSATPPADATFGIDVVYLVAGMLPRQFASIAQGIARRMLQPSAPSPVPGRSIPLGTVRGINAETEERLAEEGIYDVATLAYADPYLLLRSTSFDRRQIVNWIDEAMLIMVLPDHWQALEKNGFTGAMDVAASSNDAFLTTIETELKMTKGALSEAQHRLAADAQIQDLFNLYWDVRDKDITEEEAAQAAATSAAQGNGAGTDLQPLAFTLDETPDAVRISILDSIRAIEGVRTIENVDSAPRMWRAYVSTAHTTSVVNRLASIEHVHLETTH